MSSTTFEAARTFSAPSLSRPRRRVWRGGLQGSEFTWAIAFVVPYAAVFVAFVAYPIVYGLWMGHNPQLYTELFSDPIYLGRSDRKTARYRAAGCGPSTVRKQSDRPRRQRTPRRRAPRRRSPR